MYQTIFLLILTFLAQSATALEIIEEPQPVAENDFTIPQVQKEPHSANFEPTAGTAQPETSSRQDVAVNTRDDKGNTPLYYALTQNEDLTVAQHLLANGADVNAPTADGITPLLIATSYAKKLRLQKQQLEALQISHVSSIPAPQIQAYLDAQKKHIIDMLKMLIANGADVNQKTPFGTPLMNAATDLWNLPLVEILIEAGAAVNQQDQSGRTALFYAHLFDCADIETMLLKAGAHTDIKDRYGRTYMDIEPNLAEQMQVLIPEK